MVGVSNVSFQWKHDVNEMGQKLCKVSLTVSYIIHPHCIFLLFLWRVVVVVVFVVVVLMCILNAPV